MRGRGKGCMSHVSGECAALYNKSSTYGRQTRENFPVQRISATEMPAKYGTRFMLQAIPVVLADQRHLSEVKHGLFVPVSHS